MLKCEGMSDSELVFEAAMERYKMEVAEKLGLKEKIKEQGWESMSTSDCGRIGGKMSTRLSENLIRRMMESAAAELCRGSAENESGEGAPKIKY